MQLSNQTKLLTLLLFFCVTLSGFAGNNIPQSFTGRPISMTDNHILSIRERRTISAVLEDFQVNDILAQGDQWLPVVAVADNGNFVVVWQDNRNGENNILGQRFSSDGSALGINFQVTQEGRSWQDSAPAIAIDATGNFVVVWTDLRNGGGNADIYCQRFNADGTLRGANFIVNNDASGAWQDDPAVTCNADGYFVVVWQDQRNGSDNPDIFAQRFRPDGTTRSGNFQVNTDAGSVIQDEPAVAMDDNRNFVVTWWDRRNENDDIYAQRYNDNGVRQGNNFQVNTDGGEGGQYSPTISMSKNGDFVIAWRDWRDGNEDIYAQCFESGGNRVRGNFKVNSDIGSSSQFSPAVALSNNGDFVVTWCDQRNGNEDIYAQRYNSNGVKQGTNFLVNDDNNNVIQNNPSASIDKNGNFVIVWQDERKGNPDIYAQRYSSEGSQLAANFQVNTDCADSAQDYPDIAVAANGNFVLVWRDDRNGNYDTYAQLYLAGGTRNGDNFRVNDDTGSAVQGASNVIMDQNGNFIIVWQDHRNRDADIYAQRFNCDGTRLGVNFRVNDDNGTSQQTHPVIGMSSTGNFVIIWRDDRNGNWDIYGQQYSNNGSKLGTNFLVNDDGRNYQQSNPAVAVNSSGKFVVVWQDERNGFYDIYAQRIASSGVHQGANIKVSDDPGNTIQSCASVAMDETGNFVVVWNDARNGNYDILAQRYDVYGTPQGINFWVNDDTGTSAQFFPAIAMDENGNFIIAWEDFRNGIFNSYLDYYNCDIYAQFFDYNGNFIKGNFRVDNDKSNKEQQVPNIDIVNNQVYYTWFDNRIEGQGNDIFAKANLLSIPTAVPEGLSELKRDKFQLAQNYPNPFNPKTIIAFSLPARQAVSLKIYDLQGREIMTLINETREAGSHEITLNAQNLPSGVYFYTLQADEFRQSKKLILMK